LADIRRKVGHFLREVIMRRLAETELRFAAVRQRQAYGRARRRQADRHFRADGPEIHPLGQLIHDEAHTLVSAVKANGGAGQTSANTEHRFRCHGVVLPFI
jgi:hypothetical protein